jgi:biopolymer transport protein TolR
MPAPLAGKRRGRYRPLAEINVTPMVDVMLVLLIIFMVTAPLMTSGVSVDLPKTSAQPINSDSEPLTVTINAQGDIFLQDQKLDLDALVGKLQAIAENNQDRRIFVRGDKDLAYGRIMAVMSTITSGGFTKVALLAEGSPSTAQGATAQGATAQGAAQGATQGATPGAARTGGKPAGGAPAPVTAPSGGSSARPKG